LGPCHKEHDQCVSSDGTTDGGRRGGAVVNVSDCKVVGSSPTTTSELETIGHTDSLEIGRSDLSLDIFVNIVSILS